MLLTLISLSAACTAEQPAAGRANEAPSPRGGVPHPGSRSGGFVGTLLSSADAEVHSEAAGLVTSIPIEVGQLVAPGELLIQLENWRQTLERSSLLAAIDQYRAELQAAELSVEAAGRQLERRQAFPEIFAGEDLEQARLHRDGAVLERVAARARLEQALLRGSEADENLRRRQVRSPVAGLVVSIGVKLHEHVEDGDRLVVIGSTSAFDLVRFAVPPRWAPLVRPGRRLRIELSHVHHSCSAVVQTTGARVDSISGMVLAEAKLHDCERPDLAAYGQQVRVFLQPWSNEDSRGH